MSKSKIYVKVAAEFTPEGQLKPMWITWEDGVNLRFRELQIADVLQA